MDIIFDHIRTHSTKTINQRFFQLIRLVLCICFSATIALAGAPDSPQPSTEDKRLFVQVGPRLGYLSGYSAYHASFYDPAGSGGESKLEFPLQIILAGFSMELAKAGDRERDGFTARATWLTNLTSNSGNMKDSDWLTSDQDVDTPTPGAGYPHPGKDIYSESDTKLKVSMIDFRAGYAMPIRTDFSVGLFGGYLRKQFQYAISNTNEVGYGPYAADYTIFIPGKTLDYTVTYDIPYIGLHTGLRKGERFQASLDLGYSPLAMVRDRDDHVLRSKVSIGDTSGQAYFADLKAEWNISGSDSVQMSCESMRVLTKGTMTQTWYKTETIGQITMPAGTTVSGIEERITSSQTLITILFTHRL